MLTFDITDNFTPALFKLVFIVKVYLNEFLHLIFLNFKLLDYFSKVNIGLENQVISSSNSPLPWSFFELRFLFKSSSFCISAVRYASLVSRSSTSLECWSDDSTSIRICSISLFSSSMVWNSFIFFVPLFWKMSILYLEMKTQLNFVLLFLLGMLFLYSSKFFLVFGFLGS